MSEDREVSPSKGHRPSRRTMLRLGLLAIPATQMPLGFVPHAAAQGTKLGANLIGKLEGAEVVTDPAQLPQELQGGPAARRAGQGRQAAARPGAHRPGPAGRQAAPRDRQVRRHLAARLHRPLRHVERPPRRPERQAALLRLHGHQARARTSRAPGRSARTARSPRSQLRRGMKWSDGQPFTADDFVFWYEDVYQNKDLVPDAAVRDDDQRQADRHREDRRQHHPVRLARALLRAAHRARLRVGHRPPRAIRTRRSRRVRARPLPEAVPSEVRVEG